MPGSSWKTSCGTLYKLMRCGEQPMLYSSIHTHTHTLSGIHLGWVWPVCPWWWWFWCWWGWCWAWSDGDQRNSHLTGPECHTAGGGSSSCKYNDFSSKLCLRVCSTLLTSPLFCLSWECNFRPLYLMFSLVMFVHVHCHGAMVNGKPVGLHGLQAPSFVIISMLIWF